MKEAFERPTSAAKKTLVLVLFLSLELGASSQGLAMNYDPAGAISTGNVLAPEGVKVLAQLPLQGPPATRMYIQWEHGSTYLYIEQSGKLTAIDISKKQSLRVVNHQPEAVITPCYEEADGGPIELPSANAARIVVDNATDRGTLSVLQANDPRDAQLLRFFGYNTSNLVDRDRHLIFFASPTRLLILQDGRWYGADYSIN